MQIPYWQINAFTSKRFGGNPAGVCALDAWLPDELLQQIATENNLSETAFFVPEGDGFALRWFTPAVEVDLCGHATLAAGWVVFDRDPARAEVAFSSRSGPLAVKRCDDLLALDFPASPGDLCEAPEDLLIALGDRTPILEVCRDRRYYLVEVADEAAVLAVAPDLELLMSLDRIGVIVTARGEVADFVSRFFAPKAGIPEDPVTGSAHCTLVPYWSARLERTTLHARQLSARGGDLFCEDMRTRVLIAGNAVRYLSGTIEI